MHLFYCILKVIYIDLQNSEVKLLALLDQVFLNGLILSYLAANIAFEVSRYFFVRSLWELLSNLALKTKTVRLWRYCEEKWDDDCPTLVDCLHGFPHLDNRFILKTLLFLINCIWCVDFKFDSSICLIYFLNENVRIDVTAFYDKRFPIDKALLDVKVATLPYMTTHFGIVAYNLLIC